MGQREWRVTIKSQCWFRTTRPNPTIQMSAVPIKAVPGNFYAFILMMLPGFKAFLETCRELPQSWFTTHAMNPSLHLRLIPCQWCLTGPLSTSPKYWLPDWPCFITTAPFTLWGMRERGVCRVLRTSDGCLQRALCGSVLSGCGDGDGWGIWVVSASFPKRVPLCA